MNADTIQSINHFTGGLSLNYIGWAFFWLTLAVILVKLVRLWRRKKNGVREEKFSISYWIKDNWMGLAIHFIVAIISIRFTSQLVELLGAKINYLLETNADPMYIYLVMGLNFQVILDLIQKVGRDE